jgi:2'-5' RNA ligase
MQPAALGSFPVSRFALFRSDPGANRSVYRKVHEFSFAAATAAAT